MRRFILSTIALLGWTQISQAQVTVQQPVVQSTRLGTTVSVPDRGRTFLGGVSSASASRQSNGPLRTGTSREYGLSAGSTSASVYIIDLQAMDEAILNSGSDSPLPLSIRRRSPEADQIPRPQNAIAPAERAANFERLARQAETAGKPGVAKLHWQMAARHGSTLASEKLQVPQANAARATAGK